MRGKKITSVRPKSLPVSNLAQARHKIKTQTAQLRRLRSELRESKARLASTQSLAKLGSWELDLKTHQGIWSAEMCRLHGRKATDTMPGFTEFLGYVHPADRDAIRSMNAQLNQLTGPVTFKYRTNPSHGDVRFLESTIHTLRDVRGKVRRRIGTTLDVTERVNAENALKNRDENFRRLVEEAPEVIFIQTDGKFAFVNAAALRLFGATENELIGSPVIDRIHVDHRAAAAERMLLINELRQSTFASDVVFVAFNGDERHADVSGVPIYFRARQGALLFARDITEKKNAEQQLLASETRFRQIAECVEDVIYSVSGKTGEFTYVSPGFERMLGYTLADVAAMGGREKFLATIIENNGFEQQRKLFSEMQQGPSPHSPIWRSWWLCKDGTRKFIEDRSRAVYANGQLEFCHGVLRDMTQQMEAETSLRRSEEKFSRMFLSSPVAKTLSSLVDGRYLDVNPAFTKMFGWNRDEVVGRTVFDLNIWADFSNRQSLLDTLKKDGEVNSHEIRLRHKDGNVLHILWSGSLMDLNGKICLLGSAQDITERRRAEEELRFHQTLLEETGRLAKIGGWSFEVETGKGHWTNEVARIHDLDPQTPVTREKSIQFYADGSWEKISQAMQDAIESGKSYDLELEIISARGLRKWVRTIGHPVWENGRVKALRGSLQDITERINAEQSLRDSESLLHHIIDLVPHFIFAKDAASRHLMVNKACAAAVGMTPAEMIGKTDADFVPDRAEAEQFMGDDREVILTGKPKFVAEQPLTDATGHQRILQTVKTPLNLPGVPGPALVGVAVDITDIKRAETALREREEQLRALLARLQRAQEEERVRVAREIHDELGQLLTGLKLEVRWLEKKITAENSAVPSGLLDHAVAASQLADDTIAAVQRIAAELRPGALDQLGLAAALQQLGRQFAERNHLPCVITVPETNGGIEAQTATELYYICREALTNVSRHAKASNVSVRLETDAEKILLEVCDDGVGLPPENLQFTSSLGLLGMHERARHCQGRLELERGPAGGTRLRVQVPCIAKNIEVLP